MTVGTVIAMVAIAALLGNAGHLASAASGSAAWLRNTIDSWRLMARAGSALASGLKYLTVSAFLCTCLTGAIAAWFASKIDPPPGPRRPRRPMLAVERASTWQEARDGLGSDGHDAREQVRRALIAGYPFVAACTLLFVAIGLSAASAGSTAGWVLAGMAVVSGVSDVLENKAIAAVLRSALPRPFSPDAPLAPAPRPFALVKWASAAIATALALMLVAPPWLGKLFGSGR
jgi:hypothetical protein